MCSKVLCFILLALQLLQLNVAQSDYCSALLCDPGRMHVACNNNGNFSAKCSPDAQMVATTKPLRELILHKHNSIRDLLAGGRITGILPAARMVRMTWSRELATLAQFNVRQCELKIDQCRNTFEHPYVGQSVSVYCADRYDTVEKMLEVQIDAWVQQHKMAYMEQLTTYTAASTALGQFIQMVQDESKNVGCGILRQKIRTGEFCQYLTCDYSKGNIKDEKVYTTAEVGGSGCTTGKSEIYKNLCTELEQY